MTFRFSFLRIHAKTLIKNQANLLTKRDNDQRLVTFLTDSKMPINPRAEDYVMMSYDDAVVRHKLLSFLENNHNLKGKLAQTKLQSSTVEPMSYR